MEQEEEQNTHTITEMETETLKMEIGSYIIEKIIQKQKSENPRICVCEKNVKN